MLSYKQKYLAMKLKYISTKNKLKWGGVSAQTAMGMIDVQNIGLYGENYRDIDTKFKSHNVKLTKLLAGLNKFYTSKFMPSYKIIKNNKENMNNTIENSDELKKYFSVNKIPTQEDCAKSLNLDVDDYMNCYMEHCTKNDSHIDNITTLYKEYIWRGQFWDYLINDTHNYSIDVFLKDILERINSFNYEQIVNTIKNEYNGLNNKNKRYVNDKKFINKLRDVEIKINDIKDKIKEIENIPKSFAKAHLCIK